MSIIAYEMLEDIRTIFISDKSKWFDQYKLDNMNKMIKKLNSESSQSKETFLQEQNSLI
jgi:biotin synthase-like enzyme